MAYPTQSMQIVQQIKYPCLRDTNKSTVVMQINVPPIISSLFTFPHHKILLRYLPIYLFQCGTSECGKIPSCANPSETVFSLCLDRKYVQNIDH